MQWEDGSPYAYQNWLLKASTLSSATFIKPYLKADGVNYWTRELRDAFSTPQPSNISNHNCTAMFLLNKYTPVWIKVPCELRMGYSKIICEDQHHTASASINPLVISRSHRECPLGWLFFQAYCHVILKFASELSIQNRLSADFCNDFEDSWLVGLEHLDYLKLYFPIILGEKPIEYLLMRTNATIRQGQPVCALIPSDLETRRDIQRYPDDLYQSACNSLSDIAHGAVCQMEVHQINQNSCFVGLYQCEDKTCILEKYICDGTEHCPDSTDETSCTDVCMTTNGMRTKASHCFTKCHEPLCHCSWNYFQCLQGGCVPWWAVCDCIADCPDGSDETQCAYCRSVYKQVTHHLGFHDSGYTQTNGSTARLAPNCTSLGFSPCGSMSSDCFPTEALCVFDRLPGSKIRHCINGAHLLNCYNFECPNYYKCSFAYCIPLFKVCNGEFDCPNGEDEVSCDVGKCPNLLKCANEGSCVHPKDIHDDVTQCMLTGDDEDPLIADSCPDSCICRGYSLKCNYVNLMAIPNVYYQIKRLYLRHSKFGYSKDSFTAFHELLGLDISNNNLSQLYPNLFASQSQLIILNLSHNNLKHITLSSFVGLFNLRYMNLQFNPVETLDSFSFSSLTAIDYLDISQLKISHIENKVFYGMKHCRQLNLSFNVISKIAPGAFLGLPQLNVLDLQGNPILAFGLVEFSTIRTLPVVYMPAAEFCCKGKFSGTCYPTTTPFYCHQYIQNRVLKILGWCMVTLIALSKGLLIGWHSRRKRKRLLVAIILKHSVEILMGSSLALILLIDLLFRNSIVAMYSKVIPTNPVCLAANFIYIFSFEMSVFTSLILVIFKTYAIISPLEAKFVLTQRLLGVSSLGVIIYAVLLSFLILTRDMQIAPKSLGVSCGPLLINTEQTIPVSYIGLLCTDAVIITLMIVLSTVAVRTLLKKSTACQHGGGIYN